MTDEHEFLVRKEVFEMHCLHHREILAQLRKDIDEIRGLLQTLLKWRAWLMGGIVVLTVSTNFLFKYILEVMGS